MRIILLKALLIGGWLGATLSTESNSMAPLRTGALSRWTRPILLGLILVAAVIRLVSLDTIPPGLWYDEAIYALDGLDVANGQFAMFFTTEGHPREPLYIWSLGAFFRLFGHSVLKARIASALWGILTVVALWPLARRIVGEKWGLVAVFSFAVFRWHVHFSRTIFRALLPPLFILLVAVFFLRWREKRRPIDAILCGVCLGLGLYTYLSFRFVPILLTLWIAWLFWRGEFKWRRDWKSLALIYVAAFVVFVPLGVDYLRNPWHFTGRMDEVSMFRKEVVTRGVDGKEMREVVAKPAGEAIADLAANARDIAMMWTIRGDHVGKHNLPHAPVFDWANGLIFYLGLAWCLLYMRRNEFAFLLLAWIFLMSLTSVFSFGAPNILRMQGATPAVVLVYVLGLKWLWECLRRSLSRGVCVTTAGALLTLFSVLQLHTYFWRFPQSIAVWTEFQKETFYEPAMAVREASGSAETVYISDDLASHPTFRFVTAGLSNLRTLHSSSDIQTSGSKQVAVLATRNWLRQQGKAVEVFKVQDDSRGPSYFAVTVTAPETGRIQRIPWAVLWRIHN